MTIKFRGKRVDNGEWIFGFYWRSLDGRSWIKDIEDRIDFEVEEKTVGWSTGLHDKNKVDIYEGDVIRMEIPVDENDPLITHGIYEVVFSEGCYCLKLPEGEYALCEYLHQDCEVTGNIHDNPELLTQ